MFNVYAQRATKPDDMDDELNSELHRENMKAFDYILSLYKEEKPSVWAAWGTIVEMRPYLKDCLREIRIHSFYIHGNEISYIIFLILCLSNL